jgi:hypothetical protein
MISNYVRTSLAFVCLGINSNSSAENFTYDGSLEFEQRFFLEDNPLPGVNHFQSSARLSLELFKEWNNGDDQFVFEPFVRTDAQDSERSHVDIRQLSWSHYGDNYEISAGIGQVFWGVTESQHLVDIVNQTDGVENIDGEDKLGQAMVRYAYFNNYGTFEAFVLPYFRERTFEGSNGRLNGGLVVQSSNAIYESGAEQTHVDLAARYSNTIGNWGLGFSWFSGTSREPDLLRFADFASGSTTAYYPQIDQFGADIQLTTGGWLVKLEAIARNYVDSNYRDYTAATIGTEYTHVGAFGTVYDLGLLAEYSWDERDEQASTIFQNDAFLGARLAFNDISDSQVLFGLSNDLDNTDSRAVFIEASTRINSVLTMNIELRYFDSETLSDPLFRIKDDSFVQLGIEYYFD